MAAKRALCPECKQLVGANQLARHRRTHTDVDFECDTCGQLFSRQDHLKEHIDRKHLLPTLEVQLQNAQVAKEEAELRSAELQLRLDQLQATGSATEITRGACCTCRKRGGTLDRCCVCGQLVHFFCARLWFRPAVVMCLSCQVHTKTTPEKLEQADQERRFLDAFLTAENLQRMEIEGDGLCFFRAIASQLIEPVDNVARSLLGFLASTDVFVDFGVKAKQAKAQAARVLGDLTRLPRRWDSDMLDFVPRCVFEVYGRPVKVFEPQDRRVRVTWIPDDAPRGNPIVLCRTGVCVAQDHYDAAISV